MRESVEQIRDGILRGDRRMLARGITLLESRRPEDTAAARTLLAEIMLSAGQSLRIGISGVPGVGKSTLIETLGSRLIRKGHKVAVLAVDPSSPESGGSILGDKTRMPVLAASKHAFIRPSPTGETPGGVARKTWESVFLCEAAGYDIIFIETVGVGQSETEVASMVDFFLLMLLPGAGDSLQGIKKGITERADMLVVNKADGDSLPAARNAEAEYRRAAQMLNRNEAVVKICSALEGNGIDEVWDSVLELTGRWKQESRFEQRRLGQLFSRTLRMAEDLLLTRFREDKAVLNVMEEIRKALDENKITPSDASVKLIEAFQHSKTEFRSGKSQIN